jgi:hypothetical protein
VQSENVLTTGEGAASRPKNDDEEVLVDTFHDLPGVYMVRIVATLENCDIMS